MISRVWRLFLLLLLAVAIPSLYFLYPSSSTPHSPSEPYEAYEAGGIDSPHFRRPVRPNFENEEARWEDEQDGHDPLRYPMAGEDEGLCGSEGCEETVESEEVRYSPEAATWGKKQADTALRQQGAGKGKGVLAVGAATSDVLTGGVIMPKLENATAKAELGRAAWRVLHLMTLRYPDTPTDDDRLALKSYFHLFARLYPCGECAAEFQALLKEYPPQTSSRKSASLWLCHVHNLINERLGKPEFDCLTLDATYDCGCGDEPVVGEGSAPARGKDQAKSSSDRIAVGKQGKSGLSGARVLAGNADSASGPDKGKVLLPGVEADLDHGEAT